MSNSENSYFTKALTDFVNDFAGGDAIRHMADKGYTVDEIVEKMDYPSPKSVVSETVWKHFISQGIIRLSKPGDNDRSGRVTFVRERNAYGRTSFRQVVEYDDTDEREYVACDFGRRRYRDREAWEQELKVLDKRDREYIEGLPWPLETVYHVLDERMKRINNGLNKKD